MVRISISVEMFRHLRVTHRRQHDCRKNETGTPTPADLLDVNARDNLD
jgi:hypothetical protein